MRILMVQIWHNWAASWSLDLTVLSGVLGGIINLQLTEGSVFYVPNKFVVKRKENNIENGNPACHIQVDM